MVLLGRSYSEGCCVLCSVLIDILYPVCYRIRVCCTVHVSNGSIFVLCRVVGGESYDGVCEFWFFLKIAVHKPVGVLRIDRSG